MSRIGTLSVVKAINKPELARNDKSGDGPPSLRFKQEGLFRRRGLRFTQPHAREVGILLALVEHRNSKYRLCREDLGARFGDSRGPYGGEQQGKRNYASSIMYLISLITVDRRGFNLLFQYQDNQKRGDEKGNADGVEGTPAGFEKDGSGGKGGHGLEAEH